MKKIFILPLAMTVLLSGTINMVFACNEGDAQLPPPPPPCKCHCEQKMTKAEFSKMKKEREKHKKEFEKRLKLTQEQKSQLEANRLNDIQKIEPLKQQMRAKFDKIHQIQISNLSDTEKKQQIDVLKRDLGDLKVQVMNIRKQNMQKFEALLTDTQKIELAKLKEEQKLHHPHHPSGMPCNCPPPAPEQ